MPYFLCRSCGRRLFDASKVCKNCGGEVYEKPSYSNMLDTQGYPLVLADEPEKAENFLIENLSSAEQKEVKSVKRFRIFCDRCGRNLRESNQICSKCGGRAYVQPLTNQLNIDGKPLSENIPQEIIEQQLQQVPLLSEDMSFADNYFQEKTYNFTPYIIVAALMLLSCSPATFIGILSIILAIKGSKNDESTYKTLFYLNIIGIILFLVSFAVSLAKHFQTLPRLS